MFATWWRSDPPRNPPLPSFSARASRAGTRPADQRPDRESRHPALPGWPSTVRRAPGRRARRVRLGQKQTGGIDELDFTFRAAWQLLPLGLRHPAGPGADVASTPSCSRRFSARTT